MPLKVQKIAVYTAEIDDRPGALAEKLAPLADAKVDLAFAIARRKPDFPGKGVVYLGPIKPIKSKQAKTALETAGLVEASDLAALRIEGPNKPGALHAVTKALADAGINLRGVSASVIGKSWVCFLAFDSSNDADNAAKVVKKVK